MRQPNATSEGHQTESRLPAVRRAEFGRSSCSVKGRDLETARPQTAFADVVPGNGIEWLVERYNRRFVSIGPDCSLMSDVTQILSQIESGDPSAAEQLLPLVYDELRILAAQRMAHEKPGQTLDATALVHQAYLRLVGGDEIRQWDLGCAYYRGGEFAQAIEWLEKCIAPADNGDHLTRLETRIRVLSVLAMAYNENGNHAKAQETLDQAVELYDKQAPQPGVRK